MRFPGAPSDLRGTDLHQEFKHHPDVLTAPSKTKKSAELRRLRDAGAKKLREEWIKSEKAGYLERGCFDQGQKTTAILTPERARVCELMFISGQGQSPIHESQQWRLKLFESLQDLLCEPRNLRCPVTSCPRHIKPLATKRCLLDHLALHDRDDDPNQYLCPLTDCPRKGKLFANRRNFLRHSNTHEESEINNFLRLWDAAADAAGRGGC